MKYGARYLTDEEWTELHAMYVRHGNGPEFWDIYQTLLYSARRRTGDSRIKVANEFARVAERLGATHRAMFV